MTPNLVVPDFLITFKWWALFFGLGLVFFPLSTLLFKRFSDSGYALSKTLGAVLVSYIVFLGGVFHLFKFTSVNIVVVIIFALVTNLVIFGKNSQSILKKFKKSFKIICLQELLFTLGLFFWAYVRGHQPDIRGLEKFMDLGFINSLLRSDYLPPADMWFSGSTINYYWFGHLITAVLTKVSTIPSHFTYNLMLATILGLTVTSAFTIASTLILTISKKIKFKQIILAGLISAILLTFAGNFHTLVYVIKNGADKYWYPDATRFIGYNPETNDKTIHEFPLYSFVVSDLHAHLLNLPIVLLYLALLASHLLIKNKAKFGYSIIPMGFFLGIMFITNTWDFASYTMTTAAVLGFWQLYKNHFNLKYIIKTAFTVATIITLGILTALPFIKNFESIAQGIKLVHTHTPIWQLAVLWGFPAILTLIFAVVVYKLGRKIKPGDLFTIGLLFSSWTLIALPEIFYVKDIYIASHYRANTMFKLTYQGFVMFYLSAGYITIRSLTFVKKGFFTAGLIVFYAVSFFAVLVYAKFAVDSYYGKLATYKGLSGIAWLQKAYPSEYSAILWLKTNVSGQPTILEAPGDSYTDFNVISAYTGLPTVSGWFVHEWLWRGDSKFPQARVADISQIYTSSDIAVTKSLLAKYDVSYLIVGTFERQKFPNLNDQKLVSIGSKVFQSGSATIYKINQ